MSTTIGSGGHRQENNQIAQLLRLADAPRLQKVEGIRAGIDSASVQSLAEHLGLPKERLFEMLNLKRATVHRKIARKERLNSAETERVLGLVSIVALAQTFKPCIRDPEQFDPATWLVGWLAENNPALGGVRPGDLLDTLEGQSLVRQVLDQLTSGAYA